jgi:polysaccharide deacetylase family protein (PEP-CTERM system associated)
MITNALSIDVEEYYHAAIFRRGAKGIDASRLESRVEHSVDRLLELLRAHCTKATFFVLGEVAALHPDSVRRIAAEGHEIGCHGDRHEDVCRQTPAEFRADVRRAKARIEDVFSGPVVGYRAPNFSIGRAQRWAYQILLEEGFYYDSSTFPILHDRYGQVGAPRFPYEVWRSGSASLLEFPIGTARLFGINLPVGGGGYFRLAPFAVSRAGIGRVNSCDQRPVMFYLHPWELDGQQPRPEMSWRHRFRHYVGVEKQMAKLERLLTCFRFGTARDILDAWYVAMPDVHETVSPAFQPGQPRVSA